MNTATDRDRLVRSPHFVLIFMTCIAPCTVLAETQIYTCKSKNGGVMYSQLPCRDEVPAKAEEPAESEAIEEPSTTTDIIEFLPPDTPPDDAATRESRAACKKRYREEIDAIDAEIQREYSKENDGDYKQRLLALTRKLRAC